MCTCSSGIPSLVPKSLKAPAPICTTVRRRKSSYFRNQKKSQKNRLKPKKQSKTSLIQIQKPSLANRKNKRKKSERSSLHMISLRKEKFIEKGRAARAKQKQNLEQSTLERQKLKQSTLERQKLK